VKGNIEGDHFSFEEYESDSKDVLIPSHYIGQMLNNRILGKFKTEESNGLFEMDFSK